jgi:MFS family permease
LPDPVFRWLAGTVFERGCRAAGTDPPAPWQPGIASLAVLPQSILLGTTFPLMTAGILRRAPAQPGRLLSMLYAANSGGAAIGAMVAGFVLIPALGLPGAVLIAAVLNLTAGLIVGPLGPQGQNRPWPPRPIRVRRRSPLGGRSLSRRHGGRLLPL